MDAGSLPLWAQIAGLLAITIATALTSVFKYFKTDKEQESNNAAVLLNPSNHNTKLLIELINILKDNKDVFNGDFDRLNRKLTALKEAIEENTDASREHSELLIEFKNNLHKT